MLGTVVAGYKRGVGTRLRLVSRNNSVKGSAVIVTTTRMVVPIENRKELTQTISLLLNQSRTAWGRLSSRLYSEIDSEDNYVLMEEWESRAHWARYLKSDDFAVLFGAINALSNTAQLEFRLLSHIGGLEAISAERTGHS